MQQTKKKVLIAVHQLNLGGAQKALISALNAINYDKNEVTLYVRKDRLDLLDSVNKNVSRIVINRDRTRYYRKPCSIWLLFLIELKKLFHIDSESTRAALVEYIVKSQINYEIKTHPELSEHYDIAIAYIQDDPARLVAEKVAAERKIVFYHGSTDVHHKQNEINFPAYDAIYCVSEPALSAIKGSYPQFADKMRCIENYVDADEVRKLADGYDPGFSPDKLNICSCGRITSVKGFDLATKAAEILRDRGLDFKWYFVGDGADRGKIEGMISSLGIADRIEITGLKDNPYPYIKNCDIYVQPSYEEAHPLSVIEAQMLCRPVVSTATAGGQSLIADGKTGILAKISPEDIADKIETLAKDASFRSELSETLAEKDHSRSRERFRRLWAELLGD